MIVIKMLLIIFLLLAFYLKQKRKKDSLDELLSAMSKWALTKKGPISLPQYRYYTGLFEQIINRYHQQGRKSSLELRSIKKALMMEGKVVKRVSKFKQELFLQLFMMAFIIWSFVLMMNPKFGSIVKLALPQLLAPLIIFFGDYFLKRKYEAGIVILKENLLKTSLLLKLSFPLAAISKELCFESLERRCSKEIHLLNEKFLWLMKSKEGCGVGIDEEIEDLKEELHFYHQLSLERYFAALKVLKLMTVVICLVIPYFIFLYELMGSTLVLMGEL